MNITPRGVAKVCLPLGRLQTQTWTLHIQRTIKSAILCRQDVRIPKPSTKILLSEANENLRINLGSCEVEN
jgi:5-methylthioribose kinase